MALAEAVPLKAIDNAIVGEMKDLMIHHALPLWAGKGWDARNGGFVDRLDATGAPILDAPKRLRVQARQIYCFATAARCGWYPEGRSLALDGLDYMLARAKSPDGAPGYVSLLDPSGQMLNPARDTYDHAFVLLALVALYRLAPDPQVLAEIEAVVGFLDGHLKSEHGGYHEGLPATLPRRQNPHMHLFEAMIALFDATGDLAFQQRAGDLFALFMAHFYDPQSGALGEYFEDDWSRIVPVQVEPGHQAEWVWLLKGFERITGCPTARHRAALLAAALRYVDPATGCLCDEGDVQGGVTKTSRRLWPQTELVRAWVAQAEGGKAVAAESGKAGAAESGEAGAAEQARAALARLSRLYLSHPVRGGWYEHFDGDGRLLIEWMPASSFYHVLGAVLEADRVLGTPAAQS